MLCFRGEIVDCEWRRCWASASERTERGERAGGEL